MARLPANKVKKIKQKHSLLPTLIITCKINEYVLSNVYDDFLPVNDVLSVVLGH